MVYSTGEEYSKTWELGDANYPKLAVLRNTVYENIGTIQNIQSQYISALSQDNPTIPPGEDKPSD